MPKVLVTLVAICPSPLSTGSLRYTVTWKGKPTNFSVWIHPGKTIATRSRHIVLEKTEIPLIAVSVSWEPNTTVVGVESGDVDCTTFIIFTTDLAVAHECANTLVL
jgi:hypothetical protein